MSCCFLAAFTNSVGLAFDILGVVLLFFFGLAPEVSKPVPGTIIRYGGSPVGKDEERRYKRHWWFSYAGLWSLVIGFALQIVSNWL